MAQPGEFFPQQFAQTILQLNQQKQMRDAELVEMRNTRASQNFLEKERLDLQARGQQMDFLRSGQAQAGQEEAQKARVQLETEKIKLERDGLAVKAFDDFNRYGTAFLPNTSAADIAKFRDAYNQQSGEATGGATVHEFEIPGSGVLLQRVGGPGFEQNALELEKTRQEIEGFKQTRALQLANQQLYQERAETERTKRMNLVGGVTVRDAEFARSAIESYRKISNNQIRTSELAGDTARSTAIGLDWRQAFDKDKVAQSRISSLEAIIDAHIESVRGGRAPKDTNVDALKRAGVFDDYVGAVAEAQKAERIVGRISAPPGSTSQRDLRLGRAREGTFDVTESGKLIPVGAGNQAPPGSVLEPARDPANAAKANQVISDANSGKIPKDDPRVKEAFLFLQEYIKRTEAAQ